MRIKCGHHVLQNDCLAVLVPDERDLPWKCRTPVLGWVEVRIQRVEVALSKCDIELRNTMSVFELTLVDGFTNGEGDAFVYDSEVADAALRVDGPVDDLIYVAQNIVDGAGFFEACHLQRRSRRRGDRHLRGSSGSSIGVRYNFGSDGSGGDHSKWG